MNSLLKTDDTEDVNPPEEVMKLIQVSLMGHGMAAMKVLH